MSDLPGFGPVFPCSPLVPPLGMGMFSVCCSTVEAHNLYLILQLRFVLGLRRAFGGVNSVGPVKIMKWTDMSLEEAGAEKIWWTHYGFQSLVLRLQSCFGRL